MAFKHADKDPRCSDFPGLCEGHSTGGKLVRDRIPERMKADGVPTITRRIAGTVEHLVALRAKLNEEIAEYDAASGYDRIIDELADIIEVVYSLGELRGIEARHIDQWRRKKAEERGRFVDGLWLEAL